MKPLKLPASFDPAALKEQVKDLSRQRQPYYNAECAAHCKKLLDTLHANPGQSLLTQKGVGSLATLRIKYYNGAAYLLAHEDPDGRYKDLYQRTKCQTKGTGLLFSVREAPRTSNISDFIVVAPSWKTDLTHFLETAGPDDKFFVENLSLSEADLLWINSQLSGLTKTVDGEAVPLFFGEVNSNQILLVRDTD